MKDLIVKYLSDFFPANFPDPNDPEPDFLPICQAASADINNNPFISYKLIIPAGDYYLSDTWEIRGDWGRTVVIEAEVGPGFGTVFRPHSNFDPVVKLDDKYVPLVRKPGGLNDSFVPSNSQGFMSSGFDPDPKVHLHLDYRPLIRLRALNEGSAFRGITITGRAKNNVARLGKGLWIDGYWFDSNTFHGSNGLLIDTCKVNNVCAVLEQENNSLIPDPPGGPILGKHYFPWLPGIAIQVGLISTDGATRQVSKVKLHGTSAMGGLGPPSDPFPMRTDLGFYFHAGNMKNYTIAECDIGFCRFGIRTAGSGYTNIISCDFAANGSTVSNWNDGADFLIPQAQVNIIGCGSEGSSRFVQGDGAPRGYGALNIDACYWDSDILPLDLANENIGFVIRNVNQATHVRGLRVLTEGGKPGWAGRAGIQVTLNKLIPGGLSVINSHLDGVSTYLGDPLIYDNGNFHLPRKFEELAIYAESEDTRIVVQNCTSRAYHPAGPSDLVPLQNYELGGLKRVGGQAVKVTFVGPGFKQLKPWHHTVVASATNGSVTLRLPLATELLGREYVIKRLDEPGSSLNVVIIEIEQSDTIEGKGKITLLNLQCYRLVSAGDKGWIIVGKS